MRFSHVKSGYFARIFRNVRADYDLIREATSDYATARGTRFYLWSDGVEYAGFGIRPTGELVYVYSTASGLGDCIVTAAIERGATHLDCFDGYLTGLYSRNGFERVTSLPNHTPGGPDVVYMATPGHFDRALGRAEEDAYVATRLGILR